MKKSNTLNDDNTMSGEEHIMEDTSASRLLSETDKKDINGTQIGVGDQKLSPGHKTLSGSMLDREFPLRKNPIAEIKGELTSGWFDTNEEFE